MQHIVCVSGFTIIKVKPMRDNPRPPHQAEPEVTGGGERIVVVRMKLLSRLEPCR